jgi:hypothetical protein
MKYVTKKKAGLIGLALGAAMSLAAFTEAARAATNNYRFEAVGQPSGITLTVRVVDGTSRQPITNAHLFAIHRQWLPTKGAPQFLDHRIALTPEANGTFAYKSNDVQTGVTIRFVAQIDDQASVIWGTVRVGE